MIADLLSADERILTEPAAHVFVQDLGDNGVELVAWPFVKAADYALVKAEIVELVNKLSMRPGS